MDVQELIHKLATDQPVTETEILTLLAAIIKAKEKEIRRKAFGRYLYHYVSLN